jgi:hypothetical protein
MLKADSEAGKSVLETVLGLSDGWAVIIQTLLWIAMLGFFLYPVRKHLPGLVLALIVRVQNGAALELGPLKISEIPETIEKGQASVTTSGVQDVTDTEEATAKLAPQAVHSPVTSHLYLVHRSKVLRPRTASYSGLYQVWVRLEGDPPTALHDVTSVTYHLHESFHQRDVKITTPVNGFELSLMVYGEFAVLAFVQQSSAGPLVLSRYLDLPGRPPD